MDHNNDEEQKKPMNSFKKKMTLAARVLRGFFWKQGKPKKRGLAFIVAMLVAYLLKKKVYDRIIPSSEVVSLILKQDVKKVHNHHISLLNRLYSGVCFYCATLRHLVDTPTSWGVSPC